MTGGRVASSLTISSSPCVAQVLGAAVILIFFPEEEAERRHFAAWFRRARHYRRASSYRSANELQMRARPSSADGVTSSDTLQAIAVYLDRHLAALKTDADGDLPRSRRDRAQRSGSSTSAHHSTAPSRQEGPQRQGKVGPAHGAVAHARGHAERWRVVPAGCE